MKKRTKKRHKVEAAHEVYIWIEQLMLKAIEEHATIGGVVDIPYSIVTGIKKHEYPGVNLRVQIKIGWNGEMNGDEQITGRQDN